MSSPIRLPRSLHGALFVGASIATHVVILAIIAHPPGAKPTIPALVPGIELVTVDAATAWAPPTTTPLAKAGPLRSPRARPPRARPLRRPRPGPERALRRQTKKITAPRLPAQAQAPVRIHRRSQSASQLDSGSGRRDPRPVAQAGPGSAASVQVDSSPPLKRASNVIQQATPATASEKEASRPALARPARPQHPALLAGPRPPYPRSARRRGAQGVVVIRAKIATSGDVLETILAQSSGAQDLDHAALRAVRRWRFRPATDGRRPVEAWAQIPVRFRLTGRRL